MANHSFEIRERSVLNEPLNAAIDLATIYLSAKTVEAGTKAVKNLTHFRLYDAADETTRFIGLGALSLLGVGISSTRETMLSTALNHFFGQMSEVPHWTDVP